MIAFYYGIPCIPLQYVKPFNPFNMEDYKFIIAALDEAAETIVTMQAIALEYDRDATAAGLKVHTTPCDSDFVVCLLDKLRAAKLLAADIAAEDCEK